MNLDTISMMRTFQREAQLLERDLERRRVIREMVHDQRTGPVSRMRQLVASIRTSGPAQG